MQSPMPCWLSERNETSGIGISILSGSLIQNRSGIQIFVSYGEDAYCCKELRAVLHTTNHIPGLPMKIFEGRYSWDGTKKDDREPVSWFAGAYDLIIYRIDVASDDIEVLRPFVCIFANTGSGNSIYANPEKLALRICEDFSLTINKVLWVERLTPGKDDFEMVVFSKRGQLGEQIFYTIKRRLPTKGEMRLIDEILSKNL